MTGVEYVEYHVVAYPSIYNDPARNAQ
jgi:hypothetical protein